LKQKLHPVGVKDRDTLLKLKEKEHAERGYPFDGQLYLWDYRYYDQKFVQLSLDLDETLVKEYFPVSVIVPQIIQIYQSLLSIKFVEIKEEGWHPGDVPVVYFDYEGYLSYPIEVQQYSVWKKDAKGPEDFIGYCYLDLFPRSKSNPSSGFAFQL
jgi:Zn-dependent oligopeptidase